MVWTQVVMYDGGVAISDASSSSFLQPYTILATVLCFMGGCLASSSGIGGGGIFVPILLLCGYSTRLTVSLSTVMILGSSISTISFYCMQRHPKVRSRSLIDYTSSLVVEPIILCGTSVGILMNMSFPNWLLVIFLLILLLATSVRTFKKANQTRRKEMIETTAEASPELHTPDYGTIADPDLNESERSSHSNQERSIENSTRDLLMTGDQDQESFIDESYPWYNHPRFPLGAYTVLLATWCFVFAISLLRGSKQHSSIIGVKFCTTSYWILTICQYPVLFGLSAAIATKLYFRHRNLTIRNRTVIEGDISWNVKNSIFIPIMFLSAGIVAGMLGLGGGIVTGPLLLELGLLPQVAIATSSFMVFFTAASTGSQVISLPVAIYLIA